MSHTTGDYFRPLQDQTGLHHHPYFYPDCTVLGFYKFHLMKCLCLPANLLHVQMEVYFRMYPCYDYSHLGIPSIWLPSTIESVQLAQKAAGTRPMPSWSCQSRAWNPRWQAFKWDYLLFDRYLGHLWAIEINPHRQNFRSITLYCQRPHKCFNSALQYLLHSTGKAAYILYRYA